MLPRAITWMIVIFGVSFVLLGISHFTYGKLRWMRSLDSASEHIQKEFKGVDHISTDTLASLLDAHREKVLLIDAREPDEYAVSRIPGAINLQEPSAIARAIAALKEAPSSIITYCSIGYRSAELAEEIEEDGSIPIPVKNVLGSIFQWANEDRPLETPDGEPTTQVHPYNKTWGRLLEPAHQLEGADAVEAATSLNQR